MTLFVALQRCGERRLPSSVVAETGYYGSHEPDGMRHADVRILGAVDQLVRLCGFIVSEEHKLTNYVSHGMALN